MNPKLIRLYLMFCFSIMVAGLVQAAPTQPISYQGRLTDATGKPVPNGTYSVTFAIYADLSGGSALWTEEHNVTTSDGLFTALLGSANPFDPALFKEFPRYLGITIGSGPEMSPRILMASVPYALNAPGGTSGYWTQSGSSIYYTGGNVGIGTSTPTSALEVNGGITVSYWNGPRLTLKDGSAAAERPRISFSGDYLAVFDGDATTGHIFSFMNTFSNVRDYDASLRIHGRTTNSWGTFLDLSHDGTHGIISTDVGGISMAPANGNVSVGGSSSTAYGVHIGRDPNAYMEMVGGAPYIDFKNDSISDYDARIELDSDYGLSIHATTVAIGTKPLPLFGVLTVISDSSSMAIFAGVSAQDAGALEGLSEDSVGGGFGVLGYCPSPYGYGVYYGGRFGGSGLAVNQLDHPLDPLNKMINNYSVESTEPTYTYRGNAVLDAGGEAWVTLPDYAESITKDFQYQLTPVGASAPNLFIAQEVSGHKFKISGGSGGLKVSWTVTGTRNDLYVQKYKAPAIEMKTGARQGKYLQPELYNAPASMGVFYREESKSAAAEKK